MSRLTIISSLCILVLSACKESIEKFDKGAETNKPENVTNDSATPESDNTRLDESDRLPKSVSAAVELLVGEMSEEDKTTVQKTPKEDLIQFHHGWGTGIRNSLGLWGDNSSLLEDTGKQHPDDASMVIIEAVWEKLQSN